MRPQDVKLAKWLVKNHYLEKSSAEQALKGLNKILKTKPEKSFAHFLIEKSYLSKDEYLRAQSEMKKGKNTSSQKNELKKKKANTNENKTKEKLDAQTTYPSEESQLKKESKLNKRGNNDQDEEPSIEEAEPLIETHVNCPECHHEVEKGVTECPICSAKISKLAKITCKVCGRQYKMGTETCNYCFANLRTGQAGRETPRCGSCKAIVMPNSAICTKCGSDLGKIKEASVSLKSVLFALFFLSYIGLGALLWSMRDHIEERMKTKRLDIEIVEEINDYFQGVFPEAPEGFNEDLGKVQKVLLERAYELVKIQDWQGLHDYTLQEKEFADVNLLRFWSLSLLKLNKYDEIIALQRARPHIKDIDEMAAEVRYRKAGELYERGEVTKAYLTIKESVQLAPDIPEYTFRTGIYAFVEGEYEEAEALFKKITELEEEAFPEAHVFLSLIYEKRNKEKSREELMIFKESLEDLEMYEDVLKLLDKQ